MQQILIVNVILNLLLSSQILGTPHSSSSTPATKTAPAKPKPKGDALASDNKLKAAPVVTPEKASADLSKLADRIQKQYKQTKSATFGFEQFYLHPFLSTKESSKGEVAYDKASGSMMWNYQEPKERQKKFFIRGNKFTFYSVADKIAYTHNCYDQDTLSAAVPFLLGTGDLKNSFTLALFEGESPNKALSWITLMPKEENAPVKKIFLGVSLDGKVVESIVEDPSGGKNHFKFINFKTNPKVAASVFVFKAPPGVMVQPMPNVQCPTKTVIPTPAIKKGEVKAQPAKKS